ncbi:hypothetical protein [Thermocaproicibacter melissae]|jgi:hypothetical protein|uniref:hypothetical protein n=1 Tax=Thermocaproicibacter melissae TaxID=2966552 RepID=UPI0024B06F3D|nr:hypothetical protein [Thermocaproicibacter melissae]WBY64983.1 hypothetical protein NOG13_04645 [Thermocaproicibacter melissae]
MRSVNFVFPVHNDEGLLIRGIRRMTDFCEEYFPERYRITIADSGSTDGTERMGRSLAACCKNVDYLRGPSLMEQILSTNCCDIVGFLDLDLSAGLEHLLFIDQPLRDGAACVVNGSRFRPFSVIRVQQSLWADAVRFQFILRLLLHYRSSDALCRFKFFRRETIESLYPFCNCESCWYVCAELLLLAERSHLPVRELAVDWVSIRNASESDIRFQRAEFKHETLRILANLRNIHHFCSRRGS